jgi:hypothetical protein
MRKSVVILLCLFICCAGITGTAHAQGTGTRTQGSRGAPSGSLPVVTMTLNDQPITLGANFTSVAELSITVGQAYLVTAIVQITGRVPTTCELFAGATRYDGIPMTIPRGGEITLQNLYGQPHGDLLQVLCAGDGSVVKLTIMTAMHVAE